VPPPPGLDQEGSRYEIFHDVLGSRSSNGAGSSSAGASAKRRLAASEHYAVGLL
jgi:hypothetical protein